MITSDNHTKIEIKAISESFETLGKTQVVVINGEAVFDSIQFIGEPKSKDNHFLIKASTMNKQKLKDWLGETYYEENLVGDLTVSFRECVAGE